MRRRNQQQSDSGGGIGRLFVWTALIAVVFSVGVIIGQRLLVDDGLPPAISSAQNTPALSATDDTAGDLPDAEPDERSDLFSFYEALDTEGVQQAVLPGSAEAADDRLDETTDESAPTAGPETGSDVVADGENGVEDPGESDAARYTLQIASHATMERARIEMDRLRSMELEPQLVTGRGPDGEQLYQVRIGKFSTEDGAAAFRNKLENDHDLQALITSL